MKLYFQVVCTTTDNGANFCAAFRVDTQTDISDEGDAEQGLIPEMVDAPDVMEQMSDPDLVQTIPVKIETQLEEHYCPGLPSHRRCISHTINILATVDVSNVPRWSSGARDLFTKTVAKAQALWNAQNRKTLTAARIKTELGAKLKTPSVTRWNSLYDSMKDLHKNLETHMTQINNICMEQKPKNIQVFSQIDKEVIAEYVEIMTPVAKRLDMLQDEKNAYTGVLLPNLYLLRDDLEGMQREAEKFKHGQNLIKYLLKQPIPSKGKAKGFEARFGSLFNDDDLLVATALHPHFKLPVVRRLNERKYQAIKERILTEVKHEITLKDTHPHAGTKCERTMNDSNDPFEVSLVFIPWYLHDF